MRGDYPYFIVVLALVALVFGGIPFIKELVAHPLKNLIIFATCLVVLMLWILYKWWSN